ncbi:hypothetical protein CYMTET_49324 [Cymbomonas tetramitiformis]|uniref:Nucleoside phosphorylase domain-containing protein n=1 Tax=Cymbomonas tetramitiformis TaxID=36881 RepID=A0AAE0BQE9_9CHLO|nr:hypothetical protein CYMTET_49324 [Cymbomonas tetramitiformis]
MPNISAVSTEHSSRSLVHRRQNVADKPVRPLAAFPDVRRRFEQRRNISQAAQFRRVHKPCSVSVTVPSAETSAADSEKPKKATFTDANFPLDPEGRVYHLGVKRGEVTNRILSVGDSDRARRLAGLLDPPVEGGDLFHAESSRGFNVYTGRKLGVPITIISTGMGIPMMDFVVRETRAIVEGQMAFMRLGTCGLIDATSPVGTVSVAAKGSVFVRREPDAFSDADVEPYRISLPIPCDETLSAIAVAELKEQMGDLSNVITGLNASADSFYSSQARQGAAFDDRNGGLMDELLGRYPGLTTLEMETFHLYDLARVSHGSVIASAAAIGLAQRKSNDFIDASRIAELEERAGEALLRTLVKCELENDDDGGCTDSSIRVW